MSQAEAYLNSLTDDIAKHEHVVTDSDSHFVIDPDTRKISNSGQTENVLIQYDHNSEVFTFEIPRYVDGHDMTLCNRVRVHYNNVDGRTGKAIPDVAEMTDLRISETDSSKVISSWLISRNATQLAGTLNFLIQYMCVADDDTVVYEWHTEIYDGVYVNAGRRNGKQAIVRYSDVLEQWYQRLFGTGESVMALVEEKIEELDNEATAQINFAKQEIESKAAATLDTIPPEYTELHNYANEAARTKGDAVTHTVNGEVINVADSSDDYLRGLRVFGKTTQVKTSGKNLLDCTALSDVKNNAGADRSGFVVLIPNDGEYCYMVGHGTTSCYFGYTDSLESATTQVGTVNAGNYMTGTITLEKDQYFVVWFNPGLSLSVISQGKYMLASGTDVTYEPYSGGVASPSPEWPQELTSIENPVVDVYGKNLLKHTVSPGSHTIKGITFTVRDDGSVVCNGTATAPATLSFERCYLTEDIIVSGCPAGGDTQTYRITVDAYKNDSYVRSEFDLGNSVTIRKASYDYVNINIFFYAGTVADNMAFYPMVRHASITDATYEPYNGGSVTIPHTLPGIPVSQNGNYTDADGQQWICDEIDFERGVYVQRIGVETFDGSSDENWYLQYTSTNPILEIAPRYAKKSIDGLCTHFTTSRIISAGTETGYSTTGSGAALRFRPVDFATITIAEWKSRLAASPITATYVLASHIETPLTETELQTFKYLHSNYPNTTVLNDSGAHMELKYNVDTKNYIDTTLKGHITDMLEVIANGSY